MAGYSLGIGGGTGLFAGRSSGSDGVVFQSPITPDLASAGRGPTAHPATWVILGAFVITAVIYAHWHVY